ncbi:MAG TPA: DUF362 domain-containing protein [Candidatus Aminicenantes bacterium]|nr:DUF362 domain-containing protein [Candidatus Aminicenantes bacterium]HRY64298.1 DUF362 domain-containing protein [Candidatus Aminicenantes bacterium]HRZ71211.1 DUF362 domain-containing protein [Candidatus Aminicenantes bacterium]
MSRRSLSRREFGRLVGASALAAWPAASFAAGGAGQAVRPAGGALLQVALVTCPDYAPETLAAAVRQGWRSSRPPDVRGKRVVLKPNMVDVSAERPIHTDPRLIEALVLHLGDLGAREIVLAEGTSHNRDSEDLFRRAGYEAIARRRGVRLVDLNYDDLVPVRSVNPRATLLREMVLPRTIREAEVLISLPKMKTHKLAGITLAMKNMFGALPGMVYGWPKNTLHWNGIPLSICEINGTIKTHYAIVDGVIGMEGHGPVMGRAKKAGVLVMGDNALAVDATAARIMGVDPERVEYLALAHRIKLGSLRPEDIAVSGGRPDRVRTDFALDPEFASLRAPRG